jgi:hypothetical protein
VGTDDISGAAGDQALHDGHKLRIFAGKAVVDEPKVRGLFDADRPPEHAKPLARKPIGQDRAEIVRPFA